ncbi:serine/threonine-protein kinase [Nonomuraea typhae]|uniref:serine/threonine-protein kinase n=1 Tax=Nonomuraea typhae TaxID=2603600 RepID=UPI0015E21C92|nr:serine/threonine-protein kinase [Nonomuraea typhae]
MTSDRKQRGRRIAGRYQLQEPIGKGGMGIVWRAHDELLDRTVAVKEVRYAAALGDEVQLLNRRTMREARAAARFEHPNVIVVHDVIEEDERPWIVMQLVPSRSLGAVIKQDGPLQPGRVAEIGLAVLDALHRAHESGVLHRDVKPENVLLADDGRVVLTDFGIATLETETQLTMTGLAGTPAFIAPERLKGLPARRESDLWSLGATLYTAVEGRSPHERGMALATMHAVLTDEPDPSRNAGPLKPVIDGLLTKEPVQRLTYEETARMLRRVVMQSHTEAVVAEDDTPTDPNLKPITAVPETGTKIARPTRVDTGLARAVSDRDVSERDRADQSRAERDRAERDRADQSRAERDRAERERRERDRLERERLERDRQERDRLERERLERERAVAERELAAATAERERVRKRELERERARAREREKARERDREAARAQDIVLSHELPDADDPDSWLAQPSADYTRPAGKREGRRYGPIIAAGAAVILVAGIGGYLGLRSAPDKKEEPKRPEQTAAVTSTPEQSASPETSQPAPPSPTPTQAPSDGVLPAGWKMYKDKTGFSMALPKGWDEYKREGSQVFFRGPGAGSNAFVSVDQIDKAGPDPVADWKKQEKALKDAFGGYKKIHIKKVDYMVAAADWEFTWNTNTGETRVRNRGFVTPGGMGYSIYWHNLASRWKKDLHFFDTFAATFKPAK